MHWKPEVTESPSATTFQRRFGGSEALGLAEGAGDALVDELVDDVVDERVDDDDEGTAEHAPRNSKNARTAMTRPPRGWILVTYLPRCTTSSMVRVPENAARATLARAVTGTLALVR